MRYHLVSVVTLLVLAVACSTGPRATAPPPPPPTPTPAPTPVPEVEVPSTPQEPVPSVEQGEQLPADLAELNARGYLKDVFFDTDRWDIRPDAREALKANAEWLQAHPTIRILVEGHCDERNTREYNLALGQRRANAVKEYLAALGVSSDRVETISYGEERPFALGHNEAAWRLNRRAHFVIIGR